MAISLASLEEEVRILEELNRRQRRNLYKAYFPDELIKKWPGQDEPFFPRAQYPRHLEVIEATLTANELLFLAANRVGKSALGAYASVTWMTGLYPHWWNGRRWDRPISAWAAGDTSKTVRDIQQEILLGKPGNFGTGLIPDDRIEKVSMRQGIADAVDTVIVGHEKGKSTLTFKSYDQRRESFQGTAKDVIWLDEECPLEIYTESYLRTMTTNGLVLLTFTPLMGITEVVQNFLAEGSIERPINTQSKRVVMATWSDVPHLSPEKQEKYMAGIPPFQRDARSKGVPQLGAGAIFPVPESDITVEDFEIPAWWPRFYGLDVGWNFTAAGFWAKNPDTGISYMFDCFKVSGKRPSEVVKEIEGRVGRIRGVIDPAARGRGQSDGERLLLQYRDLGLDLGIANNAVESGLTHVWQAMVSGRFKVFKRKGEPALSEYRMYRRDEKGNVVKTNDHLMDGAWRYAYVSFIIDGQSMTVAPQTRTMEDDSMWAAFNSSGAKNKQSPLVGSV